MFFFSFLLCLALLLSFSFSSLFLSFYLLSLSFSIPFTLFLFLSYMISSFSYPHSVFLFLFVLLNSSLTISSLFFRSFVFFFSPVIVSSLSLLPVYIFIKLFPFSPPPAETSPNTMRLDVHAIWKLPKHLIILHYQNTIIIFISKLIQFNTGQLLSITLPIRLTFIQVFANACKLGDSLFFKSQEAGMR